MPTQDSSANAASPAQGDPSGIFRAEVELWDLEDPLGAPLVPSAPARVGALGLGATGEVVFDFGGLIVRAGEPGFAPAVARAHAAQRRPRCQCRAEGVEMYVARLGDGYIVKRMPQTGHRHAPGCACFEPPPTWSGLAPLLGSAITEDPVSGLTMLRLDFSLSQAAGRSLASDPGGEASDATSVNSAGARLSLRGLLHYLWDQAELTHWQPGFGGKRSWSTVRRLLLRAAEHKLAGGRPLCTRLYIPESFGVEQREALAARRSALWTAIARGSGSQDPRAPQPLMLLIGELKSFEQARYGFRAMVKHVPDLGFMIDEPLFRGLERRFGEQLKFWGACDGVRMLMIATCRVNVASGPSIVELSLMQATHEWIPIDGVFEKELIDRLVSEERSFVKCLRYNLGTQVALPSAALTDCGEMTQELHLASGAADPQQPDGLPAAFSAPWRWYTSDGAMPELPARR